MKVRMALILAAGGAAAMVVAGCGGSDPTATPPPPTATARPTATPVPAVATSAPVPTARPAPGATATAGSTVAATATRPPTQPTPFPTATPTPTAVPATPPPASAIKRGGTMSLRLINAWVIRDTYDNRGAFSQQLTQSMVNQLVMTNPYNFQNSEEVIPDLADSFQVSGDGMTYTFKLRQNVKWHDGTAFTAKDVTYSFGRALNPPAPSVVQLKSKFDPVESITSPDNFTVVIKLKRVSASFLRGIALPFAQIMPANVPDISEYNKRIPGTGPFKLKSEDTGSKVIVERNTNFWKPGLPYLDGITYLVIIDPTTAFAAFRAGQLLSGNGTYDFDWMFPQRTVVRRQFPDIQSWPFSASRYELQPSSKFPAFADKRVRTAISIGFDRKEFDSAWLEGTGTWQAGHMLPQSRGGNFGFSQAEIEKRPGFNLATRAADVASAKKLLADAGATGLKFRLITTNNPIYGRGAEIAATLLKDLGLDPQLIVHDTVAFNQALTSGNYDMAANTATLSYDDPNDNVTPWVHSKGGQNYGKWSFPVLDKLLEDQDQTLDAAKRKQLLLDAQRLLLDELPTIPLDYGKFDAFFRKEVKNTPKIYFPMSPWYRWEQVWLDV